MAQPQLIPRFTVEEYFAAKELSDIKHEYLDGNVFAMSGASWAHSVIASNVHALLHSHLRGSGCRAFSNDMRVQIATINTYYYPDVVVSCEKGQAKTLFLEQPVLIIEVLSPSTETIDRREKLFNYQRIASLREYVLIAQDLREVTIYRRDANNQWYGKVSSEHGEIQFHSLPQPLLISLDEIYEEVPFA